MRSTHFIPLLAALTGLFLASTRLGAELIWTPEAGWRVSGGALDTGQREEVSGALATMNMARTAEESRSERSALKYYSTVVKKFPNSIYASEALYRTGLIQQKQHKYHKAFLTYQSLVARYPNSEKFNQVIGEQYRIALDLFEGKRNMIFGWLPGFRSRERALGYFETIVQTAPYSDYAPLALMNASRGYKRMNEPEYAIDALDRMINTYPRSVLTPDAYLKIAQTHASLVDGPAYDQSSTKESITYFEDYMILFPGDGGMASAEEGLAKMKTVLAKSKLIMADYYMKYRHNLKAARVFYNEAITVYPDSPSADEARVKLAVIDAKLDIHAEGDGDPAKTGEPKTTQPKATEPKKPKRFWIF